MPAFPLESIEVGSHLYLTAAPGIEVGTRLRGGHFRHTVEEGIATDQHSILELVWELVRAREFPARPSRLDVLFLWQGEAHARAWHHRQDILGPGTGSRRGLYEVEVEQVSRIWAADMDLISYIGDGETVGKLMQRARRYWDRLPGRAIPRSSWTERFEIGDPETSEAARECASGGRRFRPVLICDREAAHYWQLPAYWDGRVHGEWTLAGPDLVIARRRSLSPGAGALLADPIPGVRSA